MTHHTPRRVALVATALTPVLLLAACGGNKLGEQSSSGSGPYRVFFTADMSGSTATLNRGLLSGVKVAVDDANASGGINGRKVELTVNNDENNPTSAVSALQAAINSGNKPDFVYPGGSSAVTLSLLPVTTKEKILTIGATVADQVNDPKKFPYHFGTSDRGQAYVPAFVKTAKDKGWKKVAMIFATTPTGQAAEQYYKKAIEEAGMQFVSVGYDSKALDMTPQLEQLRSQNPDALVFDGYGTPVQYLIRSRAGMGWDIPSFSDQTSSTFPFVTQFSAPELKNVQVIQSNWTVNEGKTPDEMLAFVKKVKATPEGDTLPQTGVRLATVGAAAVQLADWAGDKAKATDAEAITKTLQTELPEQGGDSTPWVADSKSPNTYRFTADNHFPTAPAETYIYIEPGMYDQDGMYVPGKRP